MRMSASLVTVAVVAALTGCQGAVPQPQPDAPASHSSTSPRLETPTPEPSACLIGFGVADGGYVNLPDLARFSDGVVVARVVGVSHLAYSTRDGQRPSCDYIEQAGAVFSVGRLIELEVETNVAGTMSPGEAVRYWLGGGRLGIDQTLEHHFGLQTPEVDDRMLALLVEPFDLDPGPNRLMADVLEVFPIDPDGRVVTPNESEHVTTDTVADLLNVASPED